MKRFFTKLTKGLRPFNNPRPAKRRERRPFLRLEEMEPRVLLNGTPIQGIEVKADTKYLSKSSFEAPQTVYSAASVIGSLNPMAQLDSAVNYANRTGNLNSQIQKGLSNVNSKLPSGFALYDVQVNLPTADKTNSELDATINPDDSVKLDFILHGISGSFSSTIPDWVNYIYWGIAGPLSWGSTPPDPQFSFTADLDVQINLPSPNQGPKAFSQPSFSITATNLHYSGDNITAQIAQVANDIGNFMPNSVGLDNPGLDGVASFFIDFDFYPLESAMQQTANSGATQFRVQIATDPQSGGAVLDYLADKPVNLPSYMSLEPKSSNNPLGNNLVLSGAPLDSQITLGQTASGGIQLTVNGQTTNFVPGIVAYVDIANGDLTSTVTVQGGAAALLPGGVNVWGAKSLVIDDSADPSGVEYDIIGSENPYVITGEVDAYFADSTTSHLAIAYQDVLSVTLDGGNHGNQFIVEQTYIPLTIYTGTGINDVDIWYPAPWDGTEASVTVIDQGPTTNTGWGASAGNGGGGGGIDGLWPTPPKRPGGIPFM